MKSVCAPQASLWGLPVSCPLRLLRPRHIVSRETAQWLLSIHLSRSLLFGPRAARDLLSNRIALVWTRVCEPCPWTFISHTGALAHWILPSGEVYPSACGVLVRQPRARVGKRGEEWSRLLRLIGSQPCDVFIAGLGTSQGTGDNWVGSREWWWLHWRWWLAFHVATSFLSFCWGEGKKKERKCGPYPRTCRSLNRQHGRTATLSTCRDTSYNGAGTP
jgi:hypothetical protein